MDSYLLNMVKQQMSMLIARGVHDNCLNKKFPTILCIEVEDIPQLHMNRELYAQNIKMLMKDQPRIMQLPFNIADVKKGKSEYLIKEILNINELFDKDLRFDFVYSTSLFSILSQTEAQEVTQFLFNLLAPLSELIVCNYLHEFEKDNPNYMQHNGNINVRTMQELNELTSHIPFKDIRTKNVMMDTGGMFGYICMRKEEKVKINDELFIELNFQPVHRLLRNSDAKAA